MRRFLLDITVDAVIFGGFYLWQVMHIEAAKTFLTIVLWILATMIIIAFFGIEPKDRHSRIGLTTIYSRISTVIQIGLMVWSGMTALAVTFFIAWFFVMVILSGKETA